jgi:putative membrane protein
MNDTNKRNGHNHRAILLATVCALMAAPAYAQSNPNPISPDNNAAAISNSSGSNSGATARIGMDKTGTTETTGAAPATAPPSSQEFVDKVAITNMFEIQAGQLAEQKAKSQQDKTFAKKMIHDHRAAENKLKTLVGGSKVAASLPTALDSDHREKLTQLRNLTGAQFDKAYNKMQQTGHKAAVMLLQEYAKNGDNAALKQWAKNTLPTIKTHLNMAEKLKS